MDDRLDECKKSLSCAIGQVNFDNNVPEDTYIPDDIESCERRLIEIIKKYTQDQKFENENSPVPVYFAGWLGAYEAAFEYLVEYGLARWASDDWEQMIVLEEDLNANSN